MLTSTSSVLTVVHHKTMSRQWGQLLDLENVVTILNPRKTSKAAQIFSQATLKTPSVEREGKKFQPRKNWK